MLQVMARFLSKRSVSRLASFFATEGTAVSRRVNWGAMDMLVADSLKVTTEYPSSFSKQLCKLLEGSKHAPKGTESQLFQSQAQAVRSNFPPSDVATRLCFQRYNPNISTQPAANLPTIPYGAIRQQHSSTAPHGSTAKAAEKVQSQSSGGKRESGGSGGGRSFFSNLQDVPLVPLLLGFAGAIPLVALAPPVAPLLPLPEDMHRRRADWHAAYGAVIASFLGAVHWGLAMAEHGHQGALTKFSISSLRYTWGVIPALLVWPSLLLPPAEKFAALSGVIGLAFLVVSGFAQFKLLPKWYIPLRLPLTVLAVGGLASSWSVAAVKSTYNRARTHEITSEEEPLPAAVRKPESKVL